MAKKTKRAKRYGADEKKAILKEYHNLRKTINALDAAKKVGVSYIGLRTWELKQGVPVLARGAKPKGKKHVGRPKGSKTKVTRRARKTSGLTPKQLKKVRKLVNKLSRMLKNA